MANTYIPTEEQYYNMKHGGTGAGMPAQQNQQQAVVPGNVQGETPEQFAKARLNFNLFAKPAQKVNPADMTYVDDGKGNIIPSWKQKPATTIPAQVASQMESLDPGTFGGGIAGTGKRASIDRPITNMDELAQVYGANPAPVQPAGTVKNTNVGTGKINTTDSKPYQAATETGGGTKPITSMEDLATAMGYTSPQEEDRLRKASIANQRILAVGDALRHIGNIAHTVNYAPSQQFNSPVEAERQRYLQGKALRDKANLTFINYQQQKAAQDQKARQWAAEFELKLADDKRKQKELEGRGALRDAQIARQNTLADLDKAKQEGVITENKYKELRNKYYPEVQKATIRQKDAAAAASRTNAWNNTRRTTAYIDNLGKNGGSGSRGSGGSTRAGYTYATKNGSITMPADFLKNSVNKRTVLTQLERDGAINQDWLDVYDRNRWNEKQQAKMLDEAVSSWLMNYDQAEGFMEKHFRGQRGGSATPGKQKIEGFGGGSGKTKIQGFGGN